MRNKLTAYSIILIANIVLLAHAVIPHHHHDQQVCFERAHFAENKEDHTHNTPAGDHKNDCNSNSTTCVLRQAFVIPTTQDRILKYCDNCTDAHHHNFYILSNFLHRDFQTVSEVVTAIPKAPTLLTSFVTTTNGLRAPPIV